MAMLHSRLLRYLDMIARTGSIRKASERLNVSASSINRQVLELEETMGVQIFHRLPKRLRLTAAGEVLIGHIRETLKEYARVQARIEQLRGISIGAVRIAANPGIADGVLLPIVTRFRRNHPGVSVTITTAPTERVFSELLGGEADLAIAYDMPRHPSVNATAIFKSSLGVVVAPGHPLAKRRGVRLSDCLEHAMVMPSRALSPYASMHESFARAGIDFKPDFVSDSVDLLRAMAKRQNVITFLSRIDIVEDLRERTLVFLPIVGGQVSSCQLTLARQDKGTTDSAINVLEIETREALRAIEAEEHLMPTGDDFA